MDMMFGSQDYIPEDELEYEEGLPLGKYEDFKFELYNHFVFIIQYHLTMDGTKRIVGFEVVPYSIKRDKK